MTQADEPADLLVELGRSPMSDALTALMRIGAILGRLATDFAGDVPRGDEYRGSCVDAEWAAMPSSGRGVSHRATLVSPNGSLRAADGTSRNVPDHRA